MIALPLIAGTLMLTLVGSSRITPEVWVTFRLGPSAQAVVTDEGCASFQQSPDGSNSVCPGLREGEQPFTEEAVSEVLGASELTALMMYGATLESESAVIRDTGVVEMAEPHRAGEFLDLFSGRAPEEAGEVALSSTLARRLGLGIGDEVSVRVGRDAAPTTVVGLIDPRSQAYPVIAPAGTTGKAWSPTQWLVLGSEPVTWEQVRSANERGWSVFSRRSR